MATSDHPHTLPITSNLLLRHLPLPTQFHHHSQFPPGHLQSPSNFPITSIFTPGQLRSPSHFTDHLQYPTKAPPTTHPISPPLPISHLGTFHHPPTFSSLPISHLGTFNYPPSFLPTPNFTHGHLQSPPHFTNEFQFPI